MYECIVIRTVWWLRCSHILHFFRVSVNFFVWFRFYFKFPSIAFVQMVDNTKLVAGEVTKGPRTAAQRLPRHMRR